MPSIHQTPISLPIILERITHWEELAEKTSCPACYIHCQSILAELELIKQLVKDK